MRVIYLVLLLLFIKPSIYAQKDYQRLVWHEEFNYQGLPDNQVWSYENGFIRNQESQYYTKARKQNAYVDKGVLEIKAIKEPFVNHQFKANGENWKQMDSLASYTSACIITKAKKSFKYGKIVVRAKLPKGKGVWPAIWLLGDNGRWPQGGEIDMMELVGKEPTHIYGTVHYENAQNSDSLKSEGGVMNIYDLDTAFHNYGIIWNKQWIQFEVDDSVYYSFPILNAHNKKNNPFHKKFYMLINLALGGAWGGKIDDTLLPQSMFIDYIRVYK